MNLTDWKSISLEFYLAGGLAFLSFLFFVFWLGARRKLKLYKKRQIADHIELEETGKTDRWFKVFTQTIPQVFWIRGETETLYVSPHFEQLTGHPESLINHFPHGLLQICHPNDCEKVEEQHRSFIKGNASSLDISFRIRKSGQHYICIRERIFRHSHTTGTRYFVGLMEDITEKQKSTEASNNQRILLDNILETNDEGIFCLDPELNCIFWNKEMESISGMPREKVVGQGNILAIFPHMEENGVAEVIRKSFEGIQTEPGEYICQLPNKRKGHTFEKYFPLRNSSGQINAVLGVIKDITEEIAREKILEKTQETYGLTLRALNDGLWDLNIPSMAMIFSDHWFEMLGYAPHELSSSISTLNQLVLGEADQRKVESMLEDLRHGRSVSIELQMVNKSGESRWMLVRGSITDYDELGNPVRAMGTQTDITKRKNYELELVEALKKAEESDRLKSSFLANMSHEIRTPLNAIVGFADLITSTEAMDEAEIANFKTQIRSNSDNLLALIDDIVLLSMLEADQLQMQVTDFKLLASVKQIAHGEYQKFGKSKADLVKLSLQTPPELKNLIIQTDQNLLEKCLAKIINNGLAYTAEGKVIIGINLETEDIVSVFIKDNGCGIHPDNQKKIFQHFTQLENGLSRSSRGTGLGLSLVNQIIEKLGGSILLDSAPGKGSTFTIRLPLRIPSERP